MAETNRTSFFIFETHDGGQTWLYLGKTTIPSTDRDRALRSFLGDPVREVTGRYVAVRESQWTPRNVDIKPKTSLTDAAMPEPQLAPPPPAVEAT